MKTTQLTHFVADRRSAQIRWVVIGTFAQTPSGAAVCIEYRVRVVPAVPVGRDRTAAMAVVREMEGQSPSDSADLEPLPPAGVPRYVFEEASQARLLSKWQRRAAADAELRSALTKEARAILAPRKRTGRPPARDIAETLRVLVDVEHAYNQDGDDPQTLEDVAAQHHMSRSALRDLIHWARHSAKPQLFTAVGPGRRGGTLTPEARALLEATDE